MNLKGDGEWVRAFGSIGLTEVDRHFGRQHALIWLGMVKQHISALDVSMHDWRAEGVQIDQPSRHMEQDSGAIHPLQDWKLEVC